MVDSITHEEVLQQKVMVHCNQLGKDMDTIIQNKLKENYGDICLESGFVDKDSIQVIRRSLGMYDSEKLRSEFAYIVEFKANVILPTEGAVLEGEVISKNKMGLYMKVGDKGEVRVLLPKDYHTESDTYDAIKVSNTVRCEIVASDFNLGNKFINCIGMLRED
jgi:DNA-directed RNA polymerase subunit E'/Rpb7